MHVKEGPTSSPHLQLGWVQRLQCHAHGLQALQGHNTMIALLASKTSAAAEGNSDSALMGAGEARRFDM